MYVVMRKYKKYVYIYIYLYIAHLALNSLADTVHCYLKTIPI